MKNNFIKVWMNYIDIYIAEFYRYERLNILKWRFCYEGLE